jgi:hypothetical protein
MARPSALIVKRFCTVGRLGNIEHAAAYEVDPCGHGAIVRNPQHRSTSV